MAGLVVTAIFGVTTPAYAQLSSGRSHQLNPNAFVGGGGTYYYSNPTNYGLYGLHICSESSYDTARFEPLNFFSSGGLELLNVAWSEAGVCLIGGATSQFSLEEGTIVYTPNSLEIPSDCVIGGGVGAALDTAWLALGGLLALHHGTIP